MLLPARNMGDDAFDACLVRSITSAQTRQRETELAAKQLFAVKLLQRVLTRKAQSEYDMPATHQATSKISDVAGTNLAMLGTCICQARNTVDPTRADATLAVPAEGRKRPNHWSRSTDSYVAKPSLLRLLSRNLHFCPDPQDFCG